MRLFVAVDPPPAVAEAVAAALRAAPQGDLRWADPSQWHVTLRFLGEVADPTPVVAALSAVPAGLAARTGGPVVASLGPVTAWLAGGRVLQVPVAGLDDLAAVVAEVVAPWAAPADHPFRGHLTLARSRRPHRGAAGHRHPAVGVAVQAQWTVTEVALVASDLGAGPAVHRALCRVPLVAAAPGPAS